jgi:hypothetical protein
LLKMFPTCFSTDRSETTKIPAIAALERALGHQREHIAFPDGERGEPVVAAAGAQKLRNDLWIESGAPGGHPAQRFDELLDVSDPVLEQVPDTRGTATGRRAEQVSRVPGLDVLGEHQHPGLGVVAADGDRGAQALVGVAGRHPHVHHCGVWVVLVHRGQQVVGVAYGGDYLVATVGQDLGQARSHYGRVSGDHDPHRGSGSFKRGTAARR